MEFRPNNLIQRDLPYIIVIMFALVACYLTITSTHSKVQEAYDKCDAFIKDYCECNSQATTYYNNYVDLGDINEIYNNNTDSERTSKGDQQTITEFNNRIE